MFSVSVNTLKSNSLCSIHPNSFLSSAFFTCHSLPLPLHLQHHNKPPVSKPIAATITPSPYPRNPPPQQQFYQPFRPPPSPLPPKYRSLDIAGRIEILTNRLGPWFEYATLIPYLTQEGFSPSSIEELTGISGVEQNRLVVATQVRDSLIQFETDPDILSFFDTGGAELLYEIRLLSASQRAAAARFLVENKFDAKGARELARSMKDFPSRRGDKGWGSFNYTLPADCLSFMYYRQAQEHKNPSDERTAALQQALAVAESEEAKKQVLVDLEGKDDDGEAKDELESRARVPVVRMRMGEVAEVSAVVVLPVCKVEEREREVLGAPWECASGGEFGVVEAEKGWNRWVVLPAWAPIVELKRGGIVVAFPDARVLPWKSNRSNEEAILVVADRGRKEVVADDGVYLVAAHNSGDRGLKVERGLALKQMGVEESLGTVVLVVRPPREEDDDQLSDEDWE
ncbi:hypothetical protein NMG60_11022189 [Bertholletia excelsa]